MIPDTAPRLVRMQDGSWGVSTTTPTLFPDGRRVPGNWDVRIHKASQHEIDSMTPDTLPGQSGSHNAHARLSPSSSHQWTKCTGSISLIEANSHRIPADNSSEYSKLGTDAHDWAAKVLLKQATIEEVPDEFRPYIDDYVDHCLALVPEGVSYMTEVSVPLWYQPDQNGTCDWAVVTNDLVVIRDYKHGAGVLVNSEGNEQLAIYGYSLIKMLEDVCEFGPATTVNIGVFQPRHRESRDVKPWIITLRDLELFCESIEYAAIQANTGLDRVRDKIISKRSEVRDVSSREILEAAPGLRFSPGDGDNGSCRWCRIKGRCDARLSAAVAGLESEEITGEEFITLLPDLDKKEAKETPEVRVELRAEGAGLTKEALTDEYLVKLLERKPAILKFLADVEETLEARVLAGENVPGLKIVMGRAGDRAWLNEDAADTFLKGQGLKQEDRYKFTLKSPTQMEEALKAKLEKSTRTANRFKELVSRSEPQKTIALSSDKREAVSANIEGFEPEEEFSIDDFEV